MKKVKGSTLIEVIVGISILVIGIIFSAKMIVEIKKGFEIRTIEEEIARDMYCVVQELKYNYKLEEIKLKSKDNSISLNYNLGLAKYLLVNELFDIEEGKSLTIKINDSNDDNVEIFVTINYAGLTYNSTEERSFIKARWMDE